MTHVLIAVDDTESSVVAAKTAHRLFGDAADYTVISVAETAPVYWGNDPLGAGMVYPLTIPAAGAAGGMPLALGGHETAGAQRHPSDDVEPTQIDIAEQTAQDVVAQAGLHEARPVGDLGDPAETIVSAAEEYGADVIVVGSHEHGWLGRLFSSSVSEQVVRKADTPVLVAR